METTTGYTLPTLCGIDTRYQHIIVSHPNDRQSMFYPINDVYTTLIKKSVRVKHPMMLEDAGDDGATSDGAENRGDVKLDAVIIFHKGVHVEQILGSKH